MTRLDKVGMKQYNIHIPWTTIIVCISLMGIVFCIAYRMGYSDTPEKIKIVERPIICSQYVYYNTSYSETDCQYWYYNNSFYTINYTTCYKGYYNITYNTPYMNI